MSSPRSHSPLSDSSSVGENGPPIPVKSWYHYLPLSLAILFILMPHPSLLITLVEFYLRASYHPFYFAFYILVPYVITFAAFSSLIVCVARNPGSPPALPSTPRLPPELSLHDALQHLDREPFHPKHWCRICQAPKPERTHHCSTCNRCTLKMDHHCLWLAHKCIGFRTYPAFLHFLVTVTLLPAYCSGISIRLLYYFLYHPYNIRESVTFHSLFLALAGAVFALTMGSFLSYHIFLLTTNQTTIEHLAQYHILRYLPSTISSPTASSSDLPLSPTDSVSSETSLNTLTRTSHTAIEYHPPLPDQLTYEQRKIVRGAHGKIRLYDVGWRENWHQVIGYEPKRTWDFIRKIWYGGVPLGDGYTFPRNPRSALQLERLARILHQTTQQAH